MQIFGYVVLLFGVIVRVRGLPRITLDDDAQALCKKYKMMCKTDKICAVQHFDWPNNITIPVCIPLSFVPVRNMICQLPPDTGRCNARYIRWYFNIHAQECSHFQYGGCEGNQNNFMSKKECEQTCIATPSIRLYDGESSALSQPAVVSSPIYEPPTVKKYEALNSVMEPVNDYDKFEIIRHKPNRIRADEATTRTRRRLDKEKEKERRRRERRKEKRRLRKLEKKEQRRLRCKKRREKGKKCKKDKKKKKGKKDKIKKIDDEKAAEKEIANIRENEVEKDPKAIVEETKKIISNEIEAAEEEAKKQERKRERRRKRKLEKQRKEQIDRNRRNLNTRDRHHELKKNSGYYSPKLFSVLGNNRRQEVPQNSLLYTLS